MNVETFWKNTRTVTQAAISSGVMPTIRGQFVEKMVEKIERLKRDGEPIGEVAFEQTADEILLDEQVQAELAKGKFTADKELDSAEDFYDDEDFYDGEALDVEYYDDDFYDEEI